MNNCNFVGNLTRDVELRYLSSGTAVINFGMAVDDPYWKDGEEVRNSTFIDLVAFGFSAETVGQLNKGDRVIVTAAAKLESWEKDGEKKYKTVFKVKEIGLLKSSGDSSAKSTKTTNATKPKTTKETVPPADDNEDIPF